MKSKNQVPNYDKLIEATFSALKNLGGSGKNDEINEGHAADGCMQFYGNSHRLCTAR